jgi:biopolymer transport protein ExbD
MLSRSFIDVLFILLLGTIVMLTHAVQLDEVDADLLRMGSGGTRELPAGDIQIVVVADDGFHCDGQTYETTPSLVASLESADPVLVVVDGSVVPHRVVMDTWSELHDAGFEVSLGAKAED